MALITVRPAGVGMLCSDLAHARLRVTAAVVADFAAMPRLVWADCSGHSFPLCAPCWERTRAAAQRLVPGIEIRDSPG
jgi:hypothetical protein